MKDALCPLHTREPVPMVNSFYNWVIEDSFQKHLIMLQTTAPFFAISFILWPNSAYRTQNRHDTQKFIYPNLPLPSTHSSGNSTNTTHLANLHAAVVSKVEQPVPNPAILGRLNA